MLAAASNHRSGSLSGRGESRARGMRKGRNIRSRAFRPEAAGPECKWGRPEGRPHSHQRVDPEGYLAPSVVAFTLRSRIGAFQLCHRCSHRHPVPSSGRSGSEDPSRFQTAVPRPDFHWSPASNGCIPPAETFAMPPRRATGRPADGDWVWRSSRTISLRRAEAFVRGDLEDRADCCRHPERLWKTPDFQTVRLVHPVGSAPSR